jgi:hypothetical protein
MSLLLSALPLYAQPATNGLPALSPAYPELPPTFWEQHQSTIIVAGFAVLAFAFYFLKVWLRPESPKILAPEVAARQALARLQGQAEDGNLMSDVSLILRRHISVTFNLPNNELTTSEYCAAIEANPEIGAELAETISSFLRELDVRKFSPSIGSAPINAAGRALEIIALAEKTSDRRDACATTS